MHQLRPFALVRFWWLDSARPLRWLSITYGVHLRVLLTLLAGWLLAVILVHVGIPAVNPRLDAVSRPFETLGTFAICLPASLHAALLHDSLSWLTVVSTRTAARLRLAWVACVIGSGYLGAAIWVHLLPADVPQTHALGVWSLALGGAVLSVVLIRHDLSAALPMAIIAIFSVGGLVPFSCNIVYNLELTRELSICAGWMLGLALIAFLCIGDRRDS